MHQLAGPLPPELVARVWPQVEGYIAKALKRGHLSEAYLPTDMLVSIIRGELQLWIVFTDKGPDAAIVTRKIDYARLSTLYVCLVGGKNMKAWLQLAMDGLEKFARQLGCKAMEGGSRQGWARAAGYKVTGVALVKEL